ncbi:hypothetical protein BHM03_00047376 [Ensete ventricosum]|nr:hypothetical protein BHM03_00047376 [Ensete ventricosum]
MEATIGGNEAWSEISSHRSVRETKASSQTTFPSKIKLPLPGLPCFILLVSPHPPRLPASFKEGGIEGSSRALGSKGSDMGGVGEGAADGDSTAGLSSEMTTKPCTHTPTHPPLVFLLASFSLPPSLHVKPSPIVNSHCHGFEIAAARY